MKLPATPVATPVRTSSLLESSERIDLSRPDNTELVRGVPRIVEAIWHFFGRPLLQSHLITSSGFRRWLLRRFGAQIGKGVCIKPGLRVKFPWYLIVGEYAWLG